MRYKTLIITLLSLFFVCMTCSDEESVREGELFPVDQGESVVFEDLGLHLGFSGVVSDSRCPTNVVCFWEGMATIRLWLDVPGSERVSFELSTSANLHILESFPTAIDTLGYRISLEKLDPYPKYPLPIHRYTAWLILEKLAAAMTR